MKLLYWMVSLGLVALEGASAMGKMLRWDIAVDAMDRLGVSDPA